MTKTDFIKSVARKSGVSQPTVRTVLNTMTAPNGVIVECMIQGDRLVLPGFGCFYTSWVRARDLTHPKTREQMSLQPRLKMHFKPGKPVIDALKAVDSEDDE